MRREGALTGCQAAGVCPSLSGCWVGQPAGMLGGVAVAAEVEACWLAAALSSAGSSSSPAIALPATCKAHACLWHASRPAETLSCTKGMHRYDPVEHEQIRAAAGRLG